MSAWILPDHIADVLPSEARHIEELRRILLDTARSYGYELVSPPMLEYLTSLLTGTGEQLGLQTFKLVDQLSGRTMGLRADTTPQVARIDAHLLNRRGVTRLCYCGPVLHTRPERPHATREPLQFGAEIFGHAGPEADLEALQLALACLRGAQVDGVHVDLADVRIAQRLLADLPAESGLRRDIHAALSVKDAAGLASLTRGLSQVSREGLLALLDLYGDQQVLDKARKVLRPVPGAEEVITHLEWLASRLDRDGVAVSFDFADLPGYAYYSGTRFGIYARGASDVLVRGGRYDEVGAVFGRNRPAAGFSLDIKQLVPLLPEVVFRPAIRAPWQDSVGLRAVIDQLRAQGETVVCGMPGHGHEVDEFQCDRELVEVSGEWIVRTV